ncbi:C-type lectin protein [Butyriboletus roseoflavus]|nr:C-type lectin protein [Butyriboletus roseoflavus]
MSAPSISQTSSYSDSWRSGISTPSSEFVPTKLYLLSPHFINGDLLEAFTSKLEKGYGDKILLSVAHKGPFDVEDVEAAVVRLGEVIPDACPVDKQWVKVPEGGAFYLVDGAPIPLGEVSSVGEFVKSHEKKEVVLTTPAEALNIFSSSGLRVVFSVSSGTDSVLPPTLGGGYATLYLLERPQVSFSPLPSIAPFGVPTPDDWRALWAAWDLVTLGMIPPAMLHQKPIDLRHKCLFYIGHIPTFLDMLMSKALDEPNTEPKYFTQIFERGIDPHVDDPEHCHRHSDVPDKDEDWPTLGSILAFRDRVRARLMRVYDDVAAGRRTLNRHVARMLAMTLEHEGWHVETLLYMLIQRAGTGTLPPPGFTTPPWSELAAAWDASARAPDTPTVTLGPTTIMLGHEDCEGDDLKPEVTHHVDGHEFGWDNENPVRAVEVGRVCMEWRPVTNEEYLAFWEAGGETRVELPPSWVLGEEGIEVRTLHGPVPIKVARHWPVLTSYDGLLAYAKSKGGRLPTEPELRLFLDTYDVGHKGGANVGFRNWHPVPATAGLDEYSGKGTNGGVWEWTSTLFCDHEGLFPTTHFPGYSTDFFDGKHHVSLGGSYATMPRLAGRRTARNFYQHNYPYPWLGARVVYDA